VNIELDVTEAFGAIDYVNAGGLTTYIDIALTDSLLEYFSLKLINFVLNMIDDPIIDEMHKQAPQELTKKFTDEGFLIVKRAIVTFDKVKGCDSVLTLEIKNDEFDLQRSWGENLTNGDKVYDIGGRLSTYPDLSLNLAVISPNKITLSFSPEDCVYIDNYSNFMSTIKALNNSIKTAPNSHNLFNLDFRNKHLAPNFDTGYRTYTDD
jgi:hypothetical protein